MLSLQSDAYTIRTGGEGNYEMFSDISTRSLETVRVGEGAGKISIGSGNAFVGYEAGKLNQKGSFGAFVGFQAGGQNLDANFCTFVGAFTGKLNQRGNANTFVGFRAGELNKDGSECVAVGAYAMRENVSGNRSVAIGYRAAERTLDGDFNTMMGAEAGQDNRSGNFNTMAGFRSGRASFRGHQNTYFGAYAGFSNAFGDGNAFVGFKAGEYLHYGSYNVAIGAYALQYTSYGSSNIAIGAFAGTTSTGSGNLFIGTQAGSNNTSGNNSVFLGSDAGSGADGSENVYIGKSAACNIDGNKNVIIGAYTLMNYTTNNSVVVGYRVGRNFKKGNSNVFIGNQVDTHDIYSSFGVAIGTKDVKTYHHAIALGENLNNSGLASVMIGKDIVSDSENTISIGNDIDISSVYVLSDPLDYRSPITQSKTYELFNIQESYSDTLYNGTQSNTSAIFAINHQTIYNSGTKRRQGYIPFIQSNLTLLFDYHLAYQGTIEPILDSPSTQYNLFEYINDTSNVEKQNFEGVNLTTNVVEILNTYKTSHHQYLVPFNIPETLYSGSIGINLIRKENTNDMYFPFYYPKNYPIVQLNQPANLVLNNLFSYIRTQCNIEAWQFRSNEWTYQTTTGYDTGLYNFHTQNVILYPPTYGTISNRLLTSNQPWNIQWYPEALFACNDTFQVATFRRLDDLNIHSDHPRTITIYDSNTYFFQSNDIYLHPLSPTYITPSHLLRKPLYTSETVQFTISSNTFLQYNNVSYSNTVVSVPYTALYEQSIQLFLTNSNTPSQETLTVQVGSDLFPIQWIYPSISNLQKTSFSNIHLILPTSNVLSRISLPSLSLDHIYVRSPPTYGQLTIPDRILNLNEITYQSYHPYEEDTCELLIQSNIGNRPLSQVYSIYFQRDSNYYTLPIYKRHETPTQSNQSSETLTFQYTFPIVKPMNTLFQDQRTVSVVNGFLPSQTSYQRAYSCNITSYNSNIGYNYRSNINFNDRYTLVNYNSGLISDLQKSRLPLPTPWNGIACNIYYYQYLGINPITNPNNGGSYNLQKRFLNNSVQQYYYYYGQSEPYYEYEPISGSQHSYWNYIKQVTREEYATFASNITIYSCNNQRIAQQYRNVQNQEFLFQSNIDSTYSFTSSNYELVTWTQPIEVSTTSNFIYTKTIEIGIPVSLVRSTDLYQKNGFYQYQSTNPYLQWIQKNVGKVTQFHQSNLEKEEMYLWLSSNLNSNQLYEYHRINLSNQRFLDFHYYNNHSNSDVSPSTSLHFSFSNYLSQPFSFTSLTDYDIAIQSLSNTIIIDNNYEMTHRILSSNTYYSVSLGSSPEIIQLFYWNPSTQQSRTMISLPITYSHRRQEIMDVNIRLSDRPNVLTSNHLSYRHPTIPPSQWIYHIRSHSNDISHTLFTQQDINESQIYILSSNVTHMTIGYDLYTLGNYYSSGTIPIQTYGQSIFPSTFLTSNSSNEWIHLNTIYEHRRIGPFWNYLDTNHSMVLSNLSLVITRQPEKGYIYSSNLALLTQTNAVHQISYMDWIQHQLHYIPYRPLELSNDRYECYLMETIDNKISISDTYEFSLKNYWSKFSPFLIDSERPIFNVNYSLIPSQLPRSYGFQQDGYSWTSNSTTLSIYSYTVPLVTESTPFTGRPYFKTSIHSESIDIGGYFNFKPLLNPMILMSSNARDLHFFVTLKPNFGTILKLNTVDPTLKYTAEPYFNYNDIIENNVFYHHFGKSNQMDTFQLKVGSAKLTNSDGSVCDLSPNPLTYQVMITSKPTVILNNPDYVYKESAQAILETSNLITTSLLNLNKGNAVIYSTCNVSLYQKTSPTTLQPITYFSQAQLASNLIYYKINSNIFQNNSNVNQPMSVHFIPSSYTNVGEDVDPISTLSYYNGLYIQDWNIYLNNYVSSNTVVLNLNSNQVVQYMRRSFDTSVFNFENRRLQIDFTLYPEQQVLYQDTDILTNQGTSFPHANYLKELETLRYQFSILDQTSNVLLNAQITHQSIMLTNWNHSVYTIPVNIRMNQFYNYSFILNDDRNNNQLSLIINNVNYLEGINYPFILPSGSNIRTFQLQANILDPLNYYNYTVTSNISQNVYLYYNLTNFPNILKFNDFNILVNTYDIRRRENNSNEQYIFSSNLNNVIIGKLLDVKGFNNICIGQNFKTVGTDSIILGNNIGINNTSQTTNTLNEIFQSIVIANNSFINTKVRDVIAIGNSILPNTNQDITDFLLKKPILIGNNITTETIDFHVNIQNTFLKTTEAPVPGIYLGTEGDIVAIGYPNNQGFSNDYQLYVNGGISYNGPLISSGEIIQKKLNFGNKIYTSGTNHSYRVRITWSNIQNDDYQAFMVSGKFRGILSDSIHVYRRFESWVTPNNDPNTSKPKGLSDFEITSYASVGITNYEHSIVRYNATSVDLILVWSTLIELTPIEKMITHLEIEVAYPNVLGTVSMILV